MANFLDNLSSYNAKAALAISNAVAAGDTQKANMMSSLKSTANDETLSEAVRLNALTALVNLGNLLEIPLPPYFPMSVQYADIQTYEGVHNDLLGIQGGAPNEYYHLTFAERAAIANAASLADITFANLIGVYSDNAGLAGVINAKQAALSAPVGDYFVKINGTTISYDNSVYLTSSTGLASGSAAGGDLTGNYPNPTVLNSAVISKVLTGWNGSASNVPVEASDSILTGMQKLNARINAIVANPGGVSSVALSTNAPAIFDGTTGQSGVATVTLGLRNQNANLFLASSSTLPNTQPTFRAIAVADLPTASGVTPQQYGSTTLIPQITVDSKGRITAITNVTAAAGGQVNSVTLSVPSGSIYSSSVTGTATDPVLNFSVQSQAPNTVYAGPASGVSNVIPSFRALVAADIANIPIPQSQVTGLVDTLSTFMTNSLANGTMYVGNASNAAVNAAVAGDLTMAYVDNNGTNEANFTIANSAVTYAKIQNVTAETILGRYSATNGTVQQLTLDPSDFTINNSTGVIGLVTPNPPTLTTKGDLLTSNGTAQVRLGIGANATLFMADDAALTGNKWVAMSGDATIAVSGALTIANSAVTLGKMANLAANSIIGNNTGSSATPIALTATQATAMLDLFDTTTTTKGLVQGSNGNTSYFLRGDNTWQPITGTGTVTSVAVDADNGFAGTVADPTGDAIITLTTTVTGILQGNGTAISAATAGTDYVAPGDVTTSGLTMVTARLLGRTNSGTGAIESISVNSSLSLASTTLGLNLAHTNVFTAQQEMTAIKLNGSTSGYVSFTPPATAGTQNYTLPAATPGGAGEFLTSTAGGALSWATPQGSGTTTNAVTFNNSGSGAASGTTFDGSSARTISYNTIGAQALNANLTGLSGLTYTSGSPLVRMTGAGTFTLDGATYVTGTATQYAVLVGGASNTVASVTGGSAGQVLRYVSGANPAWSTATYPNTTSINRILYSSSNNVVDEIVAPSDATFLRYTTTGGYSWQSAVTSLGFGTQGLITNSGTAAAPVLAVSGNSGGVVYFSNATTWASSGTLDQYELVVGGGAGSPPITINNSATAGTILTSNGNSNNPSWTAATYPTSTSINRILFSSANNVIDEIVAPNTANTFLKWDGTTFTWAAAGGGGGSGTVTSVGLQVPAFLSVSNSPITGAGDITIGLSGTALPITSGGTGGVTAITARANILPTYTANYILGVNSANTDVEWVDVTGTGNVVRATNPSLTTPSLGAATAASINKVAITAPTTSATLTLFDGSALATAGGAFSTTLTATGATNVTLPTTGTLATLAGIETFSNKTILEPKIGDTAGTGHAHFRKAAGSSPAGITNYATLFFQEQAGNKRMSVIFDTDAFQSEFLFAATTSTKTYTFPNASGTVALIDSTQTLTIPASGGTSGDIALGVSGGGTVSLLAPATVTGAGVYTLPNAYPAAATNYFLTSNLSGELAWQQILGGGDVSSNITSSTTGNFAVFANTTGKLITQSTAATLSGGTITLGTSGTQGSLVINDGTTAFTTTIRTATNATANASYILPTAIGSNTNVLAIQNAATGQLVWSATGTGDITRAGTNQVVTGDIRFQSTGVANVGLVLRNNAGTYATTFNMSSTGTAATTYITTFPAATGTVALLDVSQSWGGTQTFQNGVALTAAGTFTTAAAVASTFSGAATFSASAASAASVTINNGATSSLTNPQLLITSSGGSNIQWMSFGAGNGAAPANVGTSGATRSVGTKIAISTASNITSLDYAIGGETNAMWLSAGNSSQAAVSIKFYVQSSSSAAVASVGQFDNTASCLGLNIPLLGTATKASLSFSNTGAGFQYIRFDGTGFDNISLTSTRSNSTRIILGAAGLGTLYDAAIGVSTAAAGFWFSNTAGFSFWSNNSAAGTQNNVLALSGTAVLNLPLSTGRLQINGTQVVGTRITGYGTPTGGNRTHSFAAVSQAEQVLAQLIADLKTHGLIG